ncbi:DUF1524 domain-containing protein [Tsukamurella asaccharolytica]|uniref:DUF1524 domain-containing protein n=1 Tax=Tsukamurella asaccharolytica TaxID=2592067 RepID=A0A5C5R9A3_9ACTN|nr:DUF1524 domain-containing protein [Tsukamurella asaccharolytica]TWS18913.1 DUF1524 domain-containing protein [Tsukamurella asaccharolytica]
MSNRCAVAVVLVAVALVAPPAASAEPPSAPIGASAAEAALTTLAVKGRAPKTGYARSQFGQAWSDDVTVEYGRNGCDTRNDILRRDLVNVQLKAGTNGCKVLAGSLRDPFTGSTVDLADVQIDHTVPLSDAWQKGAQQWTAEKRRDFANDPRNLRAVDGRANRQKGDGDAATWLPSNKAYRCDYAQQIVEVKRLYGLWVTQAEANALGRLLGDCGATPAPTAAPVAPPLPSAAAATAAPRPAVAASAGGYSNCAAARAAGAAPIYAGQPGYSRKLDRDGDGIACE